MTYSLENLKCTVLGASGFIGQRLFNKLRSSGAHVWAPERQALEIFERPLGVVFYCIGLTADYSLSPFATLEAHVSYLARILEQANYEHLIYLSSTRLYDGLDIKLADCDTKLQFSTKNPRHLYDLTKALGENLCITTAQDRTSIARLSCVYDTLHNSPGFLSHLLQQISRSNSIILDSSPHYCRDYISLDDTVESLIAIAKVRPNEIFNVASGRNTFNDEIAKTLHPLGFNIFFNNRDSPPEPPQCFIDNLIGIGVRPKDTLQNIYTFAQSNKNV